MQQPALFISHGAPTLAIEPCPAHTFLRELGQKLDRPEAILICSAHHASRGVAVTCDANPDTIYDFAGFPAELYQRRYCAPGAPRVARELVESLREAGFRAFEQGGRGFDHGAWVPLSLMYPKADVPVFQLSIDLSKPPQWHYELGKAVTALRQRNILVIGSGSMTHNLGELFQGHFSVDSRPPEWVSAFSDWVAAKLKDGDIPAVLNAVEQGPFGERNHPTMDHILPLFVALGAGAGSISQRLHKSAIYGVLAMDVIGFGAHHQLRLLQ